MGEITSGVIKVPGSFIDDNAIRLGGCMTANPKKI
jgi:hypothetical protein